MRQTSTSVVRRSAAAAAALLGAGLAQAAGATPTSLQPAEAACPATFFQFAEVFLGDIAAREGFVASHVMTTRLVAAEPEPQRVSRTRPAEEALAMIPDLRDAGRTGLTELVRLGRRPQITLRRPDTDFQITLTFERRGCWRLTQIDDESL